MNLQIENFKNNFLSLINSFNNLPIGVIYYILKSEIKLIENLYYGTLNSELIKQQLEELKKEKLNSLDEAN